MVGEDSTLDVAAFRCSGRCTERGKDGPQVPLAEDQDAVGEFSSDGQHESFGEAARSRTARRDLQGVDFNEAVAMSVEEEISMCFAGSTQPTWDGRF